MKIRSLLHNQGSAYIVALLVLVVLTLVGLSLSLITQTELEIGSTERTLQRVFYSAESGISSTVAKALTEADYSTRTYRFVERNQVGVVRATTYQSDTEVSQFVPIIDPPCNLCEINDAGTYSDDSYKKVTFGVTSTAQRRRATNVGEASPLYAQKTIDTNVDVQPWKLTTEAQITAIEGNEGVIGPSSP
jgi:Tfp pilus assembly protein PilX